MSDTHCGISCYKMSFLSLQVMAFAKQRQEYYLKRQLQRAGRSDERAPGYSGIHDNAKQAAAEQFKKKQQAKSK